MKKTAIPAVQNPQVETKAETTPIMADLETEQAMSLAMKIAKLRRRRV